MKLTDFSTIGVSLYETKPFQGKFTKCRARIFYEGKNANRTIIEGEVADRLIQTVKGTPILGDYDYETGDFKSHDREAKAFGFVPLEPNVTKSTVTEVVFDVEIERVYYEVDIILWTERFHESWLMANYEKQLSMDLDTSTLDGEIEIHDGIPYYRLTNAEFIGITALGDNLRPCFKDAKIINPEIATTYASMIAAYSEFSESIEGGVEMTKLTTDVEKVEIPTEEATTTTEETNVESISNETEVTDNVASNPENADTTEVTEEVSTEETTEETKEEATTENEVSEENSETESEEESEVENEGDETTETEEVGVEESSEVSDYAAKIAGLETELADAKAKLSVYENASKEELVSRFSSRINDTEFMTEVKAKIAEYSVEELKTTLGAKLADQVLEEENKLESNTDHVLYTASNITLNSNSGWQGLVREYKETSNKK